MLFGRGLYQENALPPPTGRTVAPGPLAEGWGRGNVDRLGESTGFAASEPGDEQGVAQVAFASNVVEADWKDAGELWLLRCWKYL